MLIEELLIDFVDGGKIKGLHLPQPEAYEGFYEDISLFALSVKEEAARQERLNNIVMDTIFALAVQILQGKRQDGILLLIHWRFETFSC